jgi:purine-binding chemotaxis protein CheW
MKTGTVQSSPERQASGKASAGDAPYSSRQSDEFNKSPEMVRRILEQRAKSLAERPQEEDFGETIDVVEFRLAGERYGVESIHIAEITPLSELTPIPMTPSFVLGVVNLRGRIISVLDLKKFFELPEEGLSNLHRLIVLKSEAMEFGILADRVLGAVTIHVRDIQPPLPTLTGIGAEYLRGINVDELIILDGAKLLADTKIIVNEAGSAP